MEETNDPSCRPSLSGNLTVDRGLNLLGRFCIAFLFLDAARYHVSADGWVRTIADMRARGVPFPQPILGLAMIASTVLALALLFGFRTRWAVLGLALYTITVSSVMYTPFSGLGFIPLVLFLKDLCIFGALLTLATTLPASKG
jgi:putative oxidoreductase